MSNVHMISGPMLRQILEAIEDAIRELDCPEVAELTSAALDRKLAKARDAIKERLSD